MLDGLVEYFDKDFKIKSVEEISDEEYFNHQGSISFSTCSSASTELDYEELSTRLEKIKNRHTQTATFTLLDVLSDCINQDSVATPNTKSVAMPKRDRITRQLDNSKPLTADTT